MQPIKKFFWALTAASLMASASPAAAQTYPAKPIEWICATSPGSTAAAWCQLMGQVLSKKEVLGQPVHISYMGGGSGNEAASYAKRKPTDGYTLLHANASWSGYMSLPTFSQKPEDFEVLVKVEKFLYALGVHKDSEFKSIQDVITYAKANPGKLSVAGNKIGSLHHKLIADFFNAAGAEVNYIPYEGSGDAVKDVLGKHVPIGLGTIGQWQPHVEAGTVRPLVVVNEERVPAMAAIPIPKDIGLNYPIIHQWQGLFALKGTPPAVRKTLTEAMRKVIDSEEYQTYLKRSPHVVAAFEADEAKLKQDFQYELREFKQFLAKNGLI